MQNDELENQPENELELEAPALLVDEAELIEIAKSEGLMDNLAEEFGIDDLTDGKATDEITEADQAFISAGMETILFMSDKPVSLPKLRSVINSEVPIAVYRSLMAKLREEFAKDMRGIEIAEVSLGFQLRTKPHMSVILRKMVKTQPLKLSTTNMEVLAIIAYKQPVTKDDLDSIRGVDSGYVLRNLMEKRLVRIVGRSELPGKPMVYGTTHEFLELFSLKDLNAMPPLHEVEQMVASSEVGGEEKSHAVMTEFSKMIANDSKVLFDDSEIDTELEALRAEIAAIPTSTDFIEEQKGKEKLDAKLAELATKGLTLDAEGKVVPIGSAPEYSPSPELEAEAAAAQWERHAAMISEATQEAAEAIPATTEEAQPELDARPETEHKAEESL